MLLAPLPGSSVGMAVRDFVSEGAGLAEGSAEGEELIVGPLDSFAEGEELDVAKADTSFEARVGSTEGVEDTGFCIS